MAVCLYRGGAVRPGNAPLGLAVAAPVERRVRQLLRRGGAGVTPVTPTPDALVTAGSEPSSGGHRWPGQLRRLVLQGQLRAGLRSEERRVGEEGRSRGVPDH